MAVVVILNRRALSKFQEVKSSYNMILFGAERQTPIGVNSMLMESLSKVILEAPIENEDEIMTESATPIKVRKVSQMQVAGISRFRL